jgi:hypothetical protein
MGALRLGIENPRRNPKAASAFFASFSRAIEQFRSRGSIKVVSLRQALA